MSSWNCWVSHYMGIYKSMVSQVKSKSKELWRDCWKELTIFISRESCTGILNFRTLWSRRILKTQMRYCQWLLIWDWLNIGTKNNTCMSDVELLDTLRLRFWKLNQPMKSKLTTLSATFSLWELSSIYCNSFFILDSSKSQFSKEKRSKKS